MLDARRIFVSLSTRSSLTVRSSRDSRDDCHVTVATRTSRGIDVRISKTIHVRR